MRNAGPRLPYGLIALNLLPLAGAAFLGWDLFSILLIYWLEAACILLSGIAQAMWMGPRPLRHLLAMSLLFPIYLGPAFFAVIAYGLALLTFFYAPEPLTRWEQYPPPAELLQLAASDWRWVPMLLVLAGYLHGYVRDWLRSGAWRHASEVGVLFRLYGHMILLQLATILTAAIVVETGSGLLALAFLVLAKTGLDLARHAWERSALRKGLHEALTTRLR